MAQNNPTRTILHLNLNGDDNWCYTLEGIVSYSNKLSFIYYVHQNVIYLPSIKSNLKF